MMRNCFLTLILLVLAGCESKPVTFPVYPVSGQVLYAGAPAAGVKVFLLPTSAPVVPQVPNNPFGETDASGNFRLTTYTTGDGAAEGGYQIVLMWPEPTSEEQLEETDVDRLMGWYDGVHTKLTVQVKTGDNLIPPIQIPVITGPPQVLEGVPGRN